MRSGVTHWPRGRAFASIDYGRGIASSIFMTARVNGQVEYCWFVFPRRFHHETVHGRYLACYVHCTGHDPRHMGGASKLDRQYNVRF